MKILRITYEWPPPWIGLTPQPYEITNFQQKKGHQLDVFCGRWPFAGPLEKLPNVKLHTFFREPIPATLVLFISPVVFLYYILWRFMNKPDVIHMHGQFGVWILFYRLILKKILPFMPELKIPLVSHFHNNAQDRWNKLKEGGKNVKWYSEKIAYPLEVFANKLAIKASDAYIFVSQDVKDAAIKYYNANPEKCYVVESGVNPELFKPVDSIERDKTRRDLDFLPTDVVIINYGYLVKRKNIHLLIEALALLPENFKLILMGEGDDEYLADITLRMQDLGIMHRIRRIGPTPYKDVPVALQVSDLMVLPSEWEGFPKVVLESLSTGVPVLASGFTAQEEISGLFYLNDLSPQNIASQVQQIIACRPYVDKSLISNHYSWQARVEQIDQIYNQDFEKKSKKKKGAKNTNNQKAQAVQQNSSYQKSPQETVNDLSTNQITQLPQQPQHDVSQNQIS